MIGILIINIITLGYILYIDTKIEHIERLLKVTRIAILQRDKIINLMADQLTGCPIFDGEDTTLLGNTREEVIKYYEEKINE